MRRHVSAVFAVALALSISPARAQQPQPAPAAQSDVQLSAGEVLLDLVVTDKKGHPIGDLKPGEVEVLENGERQQVTSFGLVRIGPPPKGTVETAAPETATPAAIAASPFSGVNLILIIVDRTSVQTGNLAQVYRAGESFVNGRLATNDLVAVFASTNRPILLQNFTNNKTRLLDALKKATAGTSVPIQEATGDAARAELVRAQGDEGKTVNPADDEAVDARRNQLLTDNANGIDTAFANLRDQIQTLAVINSVLALTRVYGGVPGRKSIVLYSEGFVVNNDTKGPFEAMIGAANRANFTINTVSATGLEARVPTGAVRPAPGRPIEETDARMAVQGGESGLDRMVKSNLTNNDEALSRLAKETGGVLVRNTNDLGRGFDQIANDLRSYYALSYSPTKAELDGSFRAIEVRVSRKDTEVRARKGYYAVPGGGAEILLPFESPVLALLSAKAGPRPADFRIAMKTERFPAAGAWRVPVALAIDASALAPLPPSEAKDKSKKEVAPVDSTDFEADAVALVRDSSGTVVSKLSRASFFRVTKDRADEFRSQMLPLTQFPQPLVLAPGSYTLQIGVLDPTSKKSTVVERKITLPALPGAGQPALSSLVLSRFAAGVTDAERQAAGGDPLVVDGKTRIVPNATGQFVKSKGDKLIAYFQLLGSPSAKYEMLIQFMAGDKLVVGTAPQPLPVADANGLVSYSPVLPLDGFAPGSYRAVLYIVPPGSSQPVATAMTPFTVEP
jgi:VWFA-related protein